MIKSNEASLLNTLNVFSISEPIDLKIENLGEISLSFVKSIVLIQCLSYIKPLQIILHAPIIDSYIPPNAMALFSTLVPIV